MKNKFMKAAKRLTGLSLLDWLSSKFLTFLVESADCPQKTSQFIYKNM